MSVTTTVQRRTSTLLPIDLPGAEQNSAGYKETQEKMIDGWPGTVSYTWAEDTKDRTLDNAKLVFFQFFPNGKKVSGGIDGHVTVEGRIQGWNRPDGINGYRPIGKKRFGNALSRHFNTVGEDKTKEGWIWTGLTLN